MSFGVAVAADTGGGVLPALRALEAGGWAGVVAAVADGEVPELPVAVSMLDSVDPAGLDGDARVDLVRAWERVAAMVAGRSVAAVAAVADATEALGRPAEEARHEIGAALRLAPATAADRLQVAVELRDRLPGAWERLRAGDLGYRHAGLLVAAVRDLPQQLAERVAARVLPGAGGFTGAEFARTLRRAVLAADPASAADRHATAVAGRTLDWMPQADGMASHWALMPAEVATELWGRVTATARAVKAARAAAGLPDPGLDALRVDALVHAVLGNGGADPADPTMGTITVDGRLLPPAAISDSVGAAGRTPGTGRDQAPGAADDGSAGAGAAGTGAPGRAAREPYVPRCSCGGRQVAAVVLDLPTLLGLADHPGELAGYGPIPGPLARRMAWDRDLVRWITEPGTRRLLDRGARKYRPSQRLRDFVAARDRVCGFPGCQRPAAQCDCDHVVVFRHHGQTITVNLGPLCRQHHNAKTHGGWTLRYDPDTGTKTWTSPLGKTHTKTTHPILQ